jgi:hypothetical protein
MKEIIYYLLLVLFIIACFAGVIIINYLEEESIRKKEELIQSKVSEYIKNLNKISPLLSIRKYREDIFISETNQILKKNEIIASEIHNLISEMPLMVSQSELWQNVLEGLHQCDVGVRIFIKGSLDNNLDQSKEGIKMLTIGTGLVIDAIPGAQERYIKQLQMMQR